MDGRRDVAAFIDIYICTSHPMALALSFSEALSSLRELAILVRCGWCEWIQGRERDTDCRAEVGPSTTTISNRNGTGRESSSQQRQRKGDPSLHLYRVVGASGRAGDWLLYACV